MAALGFTHPCQHHFPLCLEVRLGPECQDSFAKIKNKLDVYCTKKLFICWFCSLQ